MTCRPRWQTVWYRHMVKGRRHDQASALGQATHSRRSAGSTDLLCGHMEPYVRHMTRQSAGAGRPVTYYWCILTFKCHYFHSAKKTAKSTTLWQVTDLVKFAVLQLALLVAYTYACAERDDRVWQREMIGDTTWLPVGESPSHYTSAPWCLAL